MNIIINPKSKERLTALSEDLPQSLLITGEQGIGLATIVRDFAGKHLAAFLEPENAKGQPDHETGTTTVEAIRHLYEQTRTKQAAKRIIVIDDAERMSRGAQAAFLKLLEEPNVSTNFMLTSHAPQLLLPTIRSRVQTLAIEPATAKQTSDFINELGVKDTKKRVQLEFLASGLPAELSRLTRDESYFTARAEVMGDARDLLSAATYKRLLIAHKYHQNRAGALQLLDSAMAITRRSLSQKPQPPLVRRLDQLLTARDHVAANHNIRLQLLDFVLQ